jgi:hypothetical protein
MAQGASCDAHSNSTCKEILSYRYVKLKDRKRSLSRKNDHNALWHYRNSHNAKFCVVEVTVKTVRVSD